MQEHGNQIKNHQKRESQAALPFIFNYRNTPPSAMVPASGWLRR